MTEKQISIKAHDSKRIYLTIGTPTRKTDKIVLFVHGLASTQLWPTMLLGSWFFRKHGYAFCRISLYYWTKDARSLRNSDLKLHAMDVDTTVKYLRKQGYKKIYGVGHSFGGLTLLRSSTSRFDGLSLWDCSSFIKYPMDKRIRRDKKTGAHYLPGSYELMMSKKYIDGMLNFPNELRLAEQVSTPTQICYADGKEGWLIDSSKRYFEHLKCRKELVAIRDADHSFATEATSNTLFRKTLRWFNKEN